VRDIVLPMHARMPLAGINLTYKGEHMGTFWEGNEALSSRVFPCLCCMCRSHVCVGPNCVCCLRCSPTACAACVAPHCVCCMCWSQLRVLRVLLPNCVCCMRCSQLLHQLHDHQLYMITSWIAGKEDAEINPQACALLRPLLPIGLQSLE